MDEAEAQDLARQVPNRPLTVEQEVKIVELMKDVPVEIRRRVRELVKERWDRQIITQACRSPAAIEAARLTVARIQGQAKEDIDRIMRISQAAVAFANKVFGKKP
jgi:hypothetical protein